VTDSASDDRELRADKGQLCVTCGEHFKYQYLYDDHLPCRAARTLDPTTAAIAAQSDDRDQLRAENLRLSKELADAGTDVETVTDDRDRLSKKLLAFLVGEFAREEGRQCDSLDLLYQPPGFHGSHIRSWTRTDYPEFFEDVAQIEQLVSAIIEVAEDDAEYETEPYLYVIRTNQYLGGRVKRRFKLSPNADITDITDISAATTAVEVDRHAKIVDLAFEKGYDQAVREIRDHFKKVENGYIVAVIEQIWLKEKTS
jgi:hypothetical protein